MKTSDFFNKITLRYVPHGLIDVKWTVDQVMACCLFIHKPGFYIKGRPLVKSNLSWVDNLVVQF